MEKKSEKYLDYYLAEVLSIIDTKPLFDIDGDSNLVFTRPIGNEEIAEKLKVRLRNGVRTDSVSVFLDDHNPNEMNFYGDAERAIWGNLNFNPRETYKFKEYFVPNKLT